MPKQTEHAQIPVKGYAVDYSLSLQDYSSMNKEELQELPASYLLDFITKQGMYVGVLKQAFTSISSFKNAGNNLLKELEDAYTSSEEKLMQLENMAVQMARSVNAQNS